MRSIYRNPIVFIISNRSSSRHRRFSFSTPTTHQYHNSRRHEEESRNIRVSVWWDIENCEVPPNANVFRIVQSITNAPSSNGIKGPMHITAFGDVTRIPRNNLELLSAVGIHVTHFPSGGQSRLMKLMYWALENPPPQHLFLISGDEAFADILHQLRRSNYNILLAGPENAPSVLCSAATMMWHWSSFLKGESLNGKLFNQPPDGPNGSWYGHFKAPLEDPYPVMEQSSPLPCNESSELASESKPRPIPKAVMKHISHILSLYPEGTPITQLRAELAQCDLSIDKDFYGYKKFSRFLLGMPHILKLYSGDDGRFLVQGINQKIPDEPCLVLNEEPNNNEVSDSDTVLRPNGGTSSTEEVSKKSIMPSTRERKLQAKSGNMQELRKEYKQNLDSSTSMYTQDLNVSANAKSKDKVNGKRQIEESPHKRDVKVIHDVDEKVIPLQQPKKIEMDSSVTKVESPVAETKDSSCEYETKVPVDNELSPTPKYGILRKLWVKIFGSDRDHEKPDKKLVSDDKNAAVISSSSEVGDSVEKNHEKPGQEKIMSKTLDLFSKESFWNELGSFIDTSQGSALFSQSKTREHLVRNLQEHGPEVLRSLSVDDLSHLIDLLISDKKWVEEHEPQTFPFKVTRLSEGNMPSINANTLSLNGLSHIFSGKQTNLGELGDRKPRNPPHTGVSRRVLSNKPKREILADCQKLVDQIVVDYPQGLNLGLFRKQFLDKHGYALDPQKLGYDKLVNLLQVMSGLRIEANLILPDSKFKSLDQNPVDFSIQESKFNTVDTNNHSESSDLSAKEDESDSAWDELGPVDSFLLTKKIEKDSRSFAAKAQNKKKQLNIAEFEPPEENYFSDSDEDTSLSKSSLNETKSKTEDVDSSLILILDQWYSEKEGIAAKGNGINEAETCTPSKTNGNGVKNKESVRKFSSKHKYGKSYTFVTKEDDSNCKDNLIDGVLSTLKSSGERSAGAT